MFGFRVRAKRILQPPAWIVRHRLESSVVSFAAATIERKPKKGKKNKRPETVTVDLNLNPHDNEPRIIENKEEVYFFSMSSPSRGL